ncbi:MAG: NifB/NifX family molybdenum-iron cluster-binding protein [Victivallaceae bacterium]|nr:NifB/NifX family molybdenum-iron cluster-binding protein [Victivallaceae bacterium]
MKIAVTCENDEVFQHFGHTPEFAVFEVENGRIVAENRLLCGETGHGALAGLLAGGDVEVLVCGGIGGGALNALAEAGIQVIGGASGNVRQVVEALLAGHLAVNADFYCHHHDGEAGHSCGSHSCGGHCGGHCH